MIVVSFCIDTQVEIQHETIIYDDEVEIQKIIIDDGTIDILQLRIDNDHVQNDIMFQVFENDEHY